MTDKRLYRDGHVVSEAAIAQAQGHDPANGSDSVGARYFVQQPVLAQFDALKTPGLGRPSSILGTTQTQWWKDTISASTATWKVWGNEVMLNRLWADLTQLAPPPSRARASTPTSRPAPRAPRSRRWWPRRPPSRPSWAATTPT